MNGLCTGSGWREDALHLEIRSESKDLVPVLAGESISFRIEGARRCTGYRPPGEHSLLPCPDSVSSISASQCEGCFEKAQILPCLRCDGERCRNPVRRGDCVQPENHAVYLASFGQGIIKVGVARWERRRERVLEQGARAAIVIARDDGQMVRRSEQAIRKSGIPDRLQPAEKLSALSRPADSGHLVEELLSALASLRHRMRASWLNQPEILDLPQTPHLESPPRLLHPAEDFSLRGEVLAASGQMIIVRRDVGDLAAVEASSLHGYMLRPLAEGQGTGGQLPLSLTV